MDNEIVVAAVGVEAENVGQNNFEKYCRVDSTWLVKKLVRFRLRRSDDVETKNAAKFYVFDETKSEQKFTLSLNKMIEIF